MVPWVTIDGGAPEATRVRMHGSKRAPLTSAHVVAGLWWRPLLLGAVRMTAAEVAPILKLNPQTVRNWI